MSDLESQSSHSTSDSEENDEEIEEEGEINYAGEFRPYEDEPLAHNARGREEAAQVADYEQDEDGIPPATLVARSRRTVLLESWCTCGNCSDALLVTAREYRCCKEILQATGKFTFEGLPVQCITSHNDYQHLTYKAVLHLVGPLLCGKEGKRYRQKGNAENE